MSTSEAREAARALYDALVGGTLQSLKAAQPQIEGLNPSSPDLADAIRRALPADTSPTVTRFVAGLAGAGALSQFPAVVREFERFAQAGGAARLTGIVTSAVAMTDAQRERITSELRARYGENLTLTFEEDESLIGGLIIRIGDQVLDNSLRTRLGSLQRKLAAG